MERLPCGCRLPVLPVAANAVQAANEGIVFARNSVKKKTTWRKISFHRFWSFMGRPVAIPRDVFKANNVVTLEGKTAAVWRLTSFVDLDPVAVGVLQKNLAEAVGADVDARVACEVAVRDAVPVEALHDGVERGNAEGEVVRDGWRGDGLGAADDVNGKRGADGVPEVEAVVEGIGDGGEVEDGLVEVRAAGHVGYVDG